MSGTDVPSSSVTPSVPPLAPLKHFVATCTVRFDIYAPDMAMATAFVAETIDDQTMTLDDADVSIEEVKYDGVDVGS